jgi:heme-degrading monooxygenase HmoA
LTYRRVEDPSEIVVLFKTHLREGADEEAYNKASKRMHELVEAIPGFISIKGYRSEDGEEIDIVRFQNEEALEVWRTQPEHRATQERGRTEFYDRYRVQACRVFREYEFSLD